MSSCVLGVSAATPAASPFEQLPALKPEAAWRMVEGCRNYAKSKGWHEAIAVVDRGGALMAFYRMDQTSLNSIQSAQRKAQASLMVRSTTRDLGAMVEKSPTPALRAAEQLALGFYVGQGGVPVLIDNQAIAAIGVGGQGPAEDEECARAGMNAALKN